MSNIKKFAEFVNESLNEGVSKIKVYDDSAGPDEDGFKLLNKLKPNDKIQFIAGDIDPDDLDIETGVMKAKDAKKLFNSQFNESLNEGLPYDAFDKKPKTKEIDPEDLTYPLETAMGQVNIETLDDITTIKQFKDLVKAMKKTGEVPAEFFALKVEDQMGIIGQAVMYI
jgi:hypothetical protein